MFAWLAENIGTIVVLLVVCVLVGLVVAKMIRDKKSGKSSCSCGSSCSSCGGGCGCCNSCKK
jgi:hypothetical protein